MMRTRYNAFLLLLLEMFSMQNYHINCILLVGADEEVLYVLSQKRGLMLGLKGGHFKEKGFILRDDCRNIC